MFSHLLIIPNTDQVKVNRHHRKRRLFLASINPLFSNRNLRLKNGDINNDPAQQLLVRNPEALLLKPADVRPGRTPYTISPNWMT